MKSIAATALIIRQQTVSEKDKRLTLLTGELGLVHAFAPGAKQMKSKLFAAAQPFHYSRLQLLRGREKYILQSAQLLHSFGGLHKDLAGLALAHYFADITQRIAPQDTEAEDLLRLFLNCLHFLSEGGRNALLLKSIFELRSMVVSGFLPELFFCLDCGCQVEEEGFFSSEEGGVLCPACCRGRKLPHLPLTLLQALRHICHAPMEKLFSFSLSNRALGVLSWITEDYLLAQTGKPYQTLAFFKSVWEEPEELQMEN